jgi:flagellar M-ring protein FliF
VGTSAGSEAQSSTVNYEISKKVATIAEPSGRLARQSVAIVVDNASVETVDAEGKSSRKSSPRTEDEMRKITDLVRAAAGIDDTRGDTLIVENIPFEATTPSSEAGEPGSGERWGLWLRIARYAALPIAVLVVILFLVRPGLRALRELRPAEGLASPPGLAPTIAELQARLALDPSAGGGAGRDMRSRLIEAAKDDPEAAALVVRGWMSDEGGR